MESDAATLDRIESKLTQLAGGLPVLTRVNRYVQRDMAYVMRRDDRLTIVSGRPLSAIEQLRILADWFHTWKQMPFQYRVISKSSLLPRWVPNMVLPRQSWRKAVPFTLRLAAWNRRFRIVGKEESRDAVIVTPIRWAWVARLCLWWYRRHRWWLEEQLIRFGFYRSPVEADYYENYRFDPPSLWGSPLRRHEQHLDRRLGGTVYVSDEPL